MAALTKETLFDGNYWHNLALTHKQSAKSWIELSAPLFKNTRGLKEQEGRKVNGTDIGGTREVKSEKSLWGMKSVLRLPQESKLPPIIVMMVQMLNPKIIIYSRYNCRQVFQRLNPSVKIVLKLV